MGYYIDRTPQGMTPVLFKKEWLIKYLSAKPAPRPVKFQPDLVCVVENGFFDAAAYCYSEREFQEFNDPRDDRVKHWLIVPNAAELAGYKPPVAVEEDSLD